MKLTQKILILGLCILVASPTLYPMIRSWVGLTPGQYYDIVPILAAMGIGGLANWVYNNFELKKKES